MNAVVRYLESLRNPVKLLQLLMIIGGVAVAYTLFASMGGEPKPWEDQRPRYIVGEMGTFERTFPSQPLPNIPVDLGGETISLREVAPGKPLVVNLWATWCAPCVEELPSLQALQDKLGDEVQVIAVAQEGGDGSRQQAMLDRVGADRLTYVLDERLALGRSLSSDVVLPITVLYDARGREVGRLTGSADWASPEAERLVRAVAGGELPR